MGAWADGSVRLWDIAAGKPLTPKLPHESRNLSWAVNRTAKTLATSTQDGVLRYWHYEPKMPMVINHRQSIFHSVISPDSKYLLACGANSVRLWHVSDGSLASDALAPGQDRAGDPRAAGQHIQGPLASLLDRNIDRLHSHVRQSDGQVPQIVAHRTDPRVQLAGIECQVMAADARVAHNPPCLRVSTRIPSSGTGSTDCTR
jgi:hypothetical protein